VLVDVARCRSCSRRDPALHLYAGSSFDPKVRFVGPTRCLSVEAVGRLHVWSGSKCDVCGSPHRGASFNPPASRAYNSNSFGEAW
jgi:hypothetical protein